MTAPAHSPLARTGSLASISAYLREDHWVYHLDVHCPGLVAGGTGTDSPLRVSGAVGRQERPETQPIRRVDVAYLERGGKAHPCRTCALQRVLHLALDGEVQVGAFVTFRPKAGTPAVSAAIEERVLRSLARLPLLRVTEAPGGPVAYGVVEEALLRTLARAFRLWRGPLSGAPVGEDTVRCFWTLLEDRRARQGGLDAGEVDELWEMAVLVSAPADDAPPRTPAPDLPGPLSRDALDRAEAALESREAVELARVLRDEETSAAVPEGSG